MTTYRVTAPDGTKFKLTGDHTPTEAELNNIFSQMNGTASEKTVNADKPDLLDKAENLATGIYQGLTGNFLDEARGAIHGLVVGAGDALTGRGDGTFSGGFERGYKQKRDEYRRDYEQAKAQNPFLTLGGEIVGGAANPLLNKVMAAMKGGQFAKAIKEGAAMGAIYGAGNSTADNLEDMTRDTIKAGLSGAALAPAVPGAVKAGKWLGDLFFPAFRANKRAAQQLIDAAGEKNLRRMAGDARQYGSNVIATGDDKVLQAAQAARQQTPEAASLIENRLYKLADERPEVTRRNIGISFGKSNKYETIDDLVESTKAKVAPIYDDLRKIGDLDAYALGKKGSKELGGRLSTQKFSNIEFGRMNPAKLEQLNVIRAANGEPPLTPEMKIPLNVVKKLYDKRVISEKMKPEEVADMVFDTFYNPNNLVDASKYPHVQAVVSPKDKISNIGFIGQNPVNGETVVKSAYREKNDRLKNVYQVVREALEGRARHQSDLSSPTQTYFSSVNPSSLGSETESLRQAARFSDVQSLNNKNISTLGRFVKDNDLIQSEIKKIRRNPEFSREMRNAADTDFSILDQVNQNLSEAIEDAKRAGHMPTVMRLTQQKNELLKQMDKIAPQYKQARNLYEAKGKALRAQAIGEDVFNPNVSPELMKRKMKDMDWLEQNTLKIGSTAELIRRLGQAQNEAVALGKMLNDNSLKKLELIYGKPSAKVFKEYAESEVKRNRNTNRVLSGSQTSEKQTLRDKTNLGLSILSNPTGAIGTLLGAGENRILQETNKAIADLLTDPRGEALIRELDKLSRQRLNQDIAEILMTTNLSAASQLNK